MQGRGYDLDLPAGHCADARDRSSSNLVTLVMSVYAAGENAGLTAGVRVEQKAGQWRALVYFTPTSVRSKTTA